MTATRGPESVQPLHDYESRQHAHCIMPTAYPPLAGGIELGPVRYNYIHISIWPIYDEYRYTYVYNVWTYPPLAGGVELGPVGRRGR